MRDHVQFCFALCMFATLLGLMISLVLGFMDGVILEGILLVGVQTILVFASILGKRYSELGHNTIERIIGFGLFLVKVEKP